jgi:hypothetical protein
VIEAFHVLAPTGIGFLLSLTSYFDKHLIEWKLADYLDDRIRRDSLSPASRTTVMNLAIGAASLVAFYSNTLIFMLNLFIAMSLYSGEAQQLLYMIFMMPIFLFSVLSLIIVFVRFDIADIPDYVWRGRTIKNWLHRISISFSVLSFIILSAGYFMNHNHPTALVSCPVPTEPPPHPSP